ncbi:MAG: uroporphyrinogen decarboxylase family protein, partial [Thermoleophilia bacterium]
AGDVDALRPLEPEKHVPFLAEAIQMVRREIEGRVPLIGFSGAPFTLASYVIEGGGSRNYVFTKQMMYGAPDVWHRFMDKMTEVVAAYLAYQIEAGAQVVQLFDSWVGILSAADYREFVQPYSRRVIESVKGVVPVIHFGTDTATLLADMRDAGGDVIGVDWRIDLSDAWDILGPQVGVQGNMDPVILYAPPAVIEERVADVLRSAAGRPGHIFNLGHGILPTTPVEHAQVMIEAVHRLSAR